MTDESSDLNDSIVRRIWMGFGVLLLVLVALVFGFKKFLEYSGTLEWEKTRAMLISEGVEFDLEKLLPEVPPDEKNFAATPLIASLVWNSPDSEEKRNLNDRFWEMRIPPRDSVDLWERKSGFPSFLSQRVTDFEEIALALTEAGEISSYQSGVPERAIQKWIEQFRSEISELDEASMRPFAVWTEPPVFDPAFYQPELSNYVEDLKEHHRFQAVRALAALATGDEKEALAALRTMFQISRTLSSQPFPIPQLVSFSCDGLAISVIWEGVAKRKWSTDGHVQISSFLSSYPASSLERLEKTMNGELITMGVQFYDYLESLPYVERRRNVTGMQTMDGSNRVPYLAAFALSPKGFLDHNRSFATTFVYEIGIRPARLRDMHSARMDSYTALYDISLSNYFSSFTSSGHSDLTNRFFRQAVIVDMGRVAVAVERFRDEHGKYPLDLVELVPRYLSKVPMDLLAREKGRTLSYRIEKGRPLIYSVGQNQSDEGGEIVWRERTPDKKVALKKGDWVWGDSQPSPEESDDP